MKQVIAIVGAAACMTVTIYAAIALAYDTGRRQLGAEISYVCAP